MNTTKSVAKKPDSALTVIDFGLGDDYQGLALQSKDVVLPHIQLLQKGVEWEELDDIAWKPGDFFNSATNEVTKGAFEALVIDMKVTTRMSGPKDAGGRREVIKFSSDGIHWDDDGSLIVPADRQGNNKEDYLDGAAVDTYHYVIIVKDTDFPILLTFKGASYQNAKTMNIALKMLSKDKIKPTWCVWTKFSSEQGESKGNKFYKLKGTVQPKKPLQNQDLADLAFGTWEANQTRRVVSEEMAPPTEDPSYD